MYAFLLIIICVAFLTSEVVTDNSPLHYYEGFFSFLYLLSIFFLFYVFCYLLHESTCCRSDPEPAAYFQVLSLIIAILWYFSTKMLVIVLQKWLGNNLSSFLHKLIQLIQSKYKNYWVFRNAKLTFSRNTWKLTPFFLN